MNWVVRGNAFARHVAVGIVCTVGASTVRAEAPRRPVVFVEVDGEGLDTLGTRARGAARAAITRVVAEPGALSVLSFGAFGSESARLVAAARADFETGRTAFMNVEPEAAIAALVAAVEGFTRGAAALEEAAPLADALLYLGASYAFAGDVRAAQRVFAQLHVQFPDHAPDPTVFNPEIVAAYENAAPRDRDRPASRIRVDLGAMTDADVYVNFVGRGRGTVDVDGLLGGEHLIRVVRPGFRAFVQTVSVRRGATTVVRAALEPADDASELAPLLELPLRADPAQLTQESGAVQLSNRVDADVVAVISLALGDSPGDIAATIDVYRVATGARAVRGRHTANAAPGEFERAIARLVAESLAQLDVLRDRAPPRAPIEAGETVPMIADGASSEGPPIYERWWFWTGVGAAVVGGIVVGVALASGGGDGGPGGGEILLEF